MDVRRLSGVLMQGVEVVVRRCGLLQCGRCPLCLREAGSGKCSHGIEGHLLQEAEPYGCRMSMHLRRLILTLGVHAACECTLRLDTCCGNALYRVMVLGRRLLYFCSLMCVACMFVDRVPAD